MPQHTQGQQQIQIRASDDLIRGVYANAMQVVHTKEEFVLDFLNLYSHQGIGAVTARIITSPGHMKRIVAALADNMKKYEQQFGTIEAADQPAEGDVGFKT